MLIYILCHSTIGLVMLKENDVKSKRGYKLLISKFLNQKVIRQMLAVSSSNVFAMGIGFFTNLLLAKRMGIHDYGILSFSFAVFNFVAIFMEFGFYSTAAKLLADNTNPILERKLFGGIIVAYMIINIFFSFVLFGIGCYIDDFFDDKIGTYLRMIAFSGYAYTAPYFMEWILKGCNKIYLLTGFNICNKVMYLLSLVTLLLFDKLEVVYVLFFYSFCIGLAMLISFIRLKPIFTNIRGTLKLLYQNNKIYGWPQYVGRVTDVGAANINTLLISYFLNAEAVGQFSLAVSFSRVVSVLSQGLSIAKFKDFASTVRIDSSIFKIVKSTTTLSVGIVIVANGIVVFGFLGADYHPVFFYTLLTIAGMVAQAFYSPYNTWLVSKGFNRELRNASFKIAVLDIFTNPVFTFIGGVPGTCIAFSLGYGYSLFLYKQLYNRYSLA